MGKEIEVRAAEKYEKVPTPYGAIRRKFVSVPFDTYIRRRIQAGELEVRKADIHRKERKKTEKRR